MIPGRNAEPLRYLDAVPDSGEATIVRLADGREFLDVNTAHPEEDIERLRQGWLCIRCGEPQSQAFPIVCEQPPPPEGTGCNFPIRRLQAEEFAWKFKGTVQLGSRIDYQDELERMKQITEFEERTGAIVPSHTRNQL